MTAKKLNTAQTLMLSFFGPVGRDRVHGYKALFAHRGTPQKPRIARDVRFGTRVSDDKMIVRLPRLFKGFRK